MIWSFTADNPLLSFCELTKLRRQIRGCEPHLIRMSEAPVVAAKRTKKEANRNPTVGDNPHTVAYSNTPDLDADAQVLPRVSEYLSKGLDLKRCGMNLRATAVLPSSNGFTWNAASIALIAVLASMAKRRSVVP